MKKNEYKHTEESIVKMKESWTPKRKAKHSAFMKENNPMRDPKNRAAQRAAMIGHTTSKETRDKISASMMGKKSPNFGKSPSEETIAKMRASWTPERRARHSEFMKKNNPAKRPEVRAKLSAGRMGALNPMFGKSPSEETRDKQRASWTPEMRAWMREINLGPNSPSWKEDAGPHALQMREWRRKKRLKELNDE